MLHFNFKKTMRTCCLFAAMMVVSMTASASPPLIVADDMITVSGGAVSPDNPDVYVIDMGNYANGATYSVTVNRPKGAQANYPVSIQFFVEYQNGVFEMEEILYPYVFEFAAGETQKTLTFTATGTLENSETNVYLMFGTGSRTKAQYPVVKMHFSNPNPVTPAVPGSELNYVGVNGNLMYPIGSYILLSVDGGGSGHFFNVQDNTRLRVNRQYIDHEAYPVFTSDSFHAQSQAVLLKPEQPAGAVTNQLNFLYKLTEDAIINDYQRTSSPGEDKSAPGPCFVRQADIITNLQVVPQQTLFEQFPVNDINDGMGDALSVILNGYQYMDVPVLFGAITADAVSYDKGATIVLTIPVLNGKLMQKLFPNNEWLDNIDVTLDGGLTFLNHAYITFDGVNNNIIAIVEAKNETASPVTVTAEVRLQKLDNRQEARSKGMTDSNSYYYPYGANVAFTVTAQQASFQAIESIDLTLPENNRISLSTPNVALLAKVNPVAATFKTGTWTSSDPAVAEVSVNGILSLKAYGKTTITYTSDEAGYRSTNGLPANNETLVRTFDIYVVGDAPEWEIPGGYEYYKMTYEPEDCRLLISHNLNGNAWQVDGEVAVEVIHSDSAKYHSITDAFEVTPDMIDEDWFKYTIPFDERSFPKNVTAWEGWMADSIITKPYLVVMSVPLKQTIGDMEMTRVLRDTFAVHLTLPTQPVVRLVKDVPAEMLSGDELVVKYEIKYLNKLQRMDEQGFEIKIGGGRGWSSAYEGYEGHLQFDYMFRCPNNEDYKTFLTGKGGDWSLASEAPDWLELTDMGYYYNAVATIKYQLPAPLGALNSDYVASNYYRDAYEEFFTDVTVENIRGFIGDHEVFGEVLYKTSTSSWERKRVNAYSIDFKLLDKKSNHHTYGQSAIPLANWDEEGYRMAEMLPLVEEGNRSGDFSAFNDYMKSKAGKEIEGIYSPDVWGELVAGITRTGSNDTVYTMVDKNQYGNRSLDVLYPFNGGEYDLVLRYPKQGKSNSYHYSTDSITGQLYNLSFGLSEMSLVNGKWTYPATISSDYPIEISYMNGDSVQVNIVKPANTGLQYIIHEPKGFIGAVSYKQFNLAETKWLSGAVTPTSIGEGAAYTATLSPTGGLSAHVYSKSLSSSACYNTEQDFIPLTLLDEDTGERIAANVRIHYAGEKEGIAQFFEEDWIELVTVEEFKQFLKDEYINVCEGPCDIQIENWSDGSTTYRANTQEALDKVNQFYQSKLNEYIAQHVSSSADGYLQGSETGSVTAATDGYYLIPFIKVTDNGADVGREPESHDLWSYPEYAFFNGSSVGLKWKKAHYVLDIVADGYYPKLATFDPDPQLGAIGETGLTVTLRKKTDALSQPDIKIWTEKPVTNMPFWKGTGTEYRYEGDFSIYGIYDFGIHDKQDLTTKGRNSITTFSRYANTQSAVLNVSLPLENDWTPEALMLTTQKGSMTPMNYTLVSPETYPGFETTYAHLSYRLNNLIDYGSDEQGNPIAENVAYPDIKINGDVIAELPGLFNEEVDPKVYEDEITQEIKDNVRLSPGQFDIESMTGEAKNGGSQDKALDRANEFDFSLPDPIPFEFQTRTEGNRYYVRGIASVNFADAIPIVGQLNTASDLIGRANEFDAAFNELKGAVKMRTKNGTPRSSSLNVFAGLRGYMEGYGEYDPLTRSYEYGINEGGVSVELSASAYVKAPMGLVNVGVGVDIGIAGVEVGVTGRAGFKNANKLVLKPYLPSGDNQFFTAGGYFNIYANMYAWAHAYFLFWSWQDEWKIFDASKTWYYPNNDSNPYLRSGGAPQMRSLASSYKRSTLAMPNTIIEDVAANAYPRYLGDGHSLMLSNLKAPAEQNDDRISVYTSGSTSDMLPASTLPAYGFDVATSANGVSVAAYEQASESIQPKADNVSQETYIKTQSNNMDVFAAIKNGGDWQTFQLSDVGQSPADRKTDMAPKTAVSPDGTKAAVVWRSGFTKIDAGGAKVSGDLKLSRYNGTSWSDEPLNLGSADNLADYSLAIDGDSIVVAAMRMGTDSIGKIKLIYISAADSIKHIETGRIGRKPQIVSTGENYSVGFMGQYAKNDTTNVNDMYLLAIQKNGQPIDSISGFAGMANKVSFAYKLLSEPVAKGVDDLAILYNASKVVNENEVQTSLYAAKLGRQNGKIFASEPAKLLTVPEEQLIISFDGYKTGNSLKAAATISNENHGAIVVEETAAFENRVVCLTESFNTAEIKPGQDVNVEFEVQNTGFKPVSSLAVKIGSGATSTTVGEVMPGGIQVVRGAATVPVNNTEPVPYTITAAFADGSTSIATGTLDLTAYLVKVNLVSLKTTDTQNTAVVQIVNKSATPLTAQHEVTVGIYEDIFGEKLYKNTALQTFSYSDLYKDGMDGMDAQILSTAFDIPTVEETTSVYAIAKVVRRNASDLRAGGSEDVEQAEKNYASIQLFPVKGVNVPTKIEDTPKKESNGIRIYVRNDCAVIEGQITAPVEVYTTTGVLLKTVIQTETPIVIPLPKGIYLIKVDGQTGKVVI